MWNRQHWSCFWRKIIVVSHLHPTGWPYSGQRWVVCYSQKTDYTFSPGPLSPSFLIPLSLLRALELSAMYWPWSLMHSHTHTSSQPFPYSSSVPLSLCFSSLSSSLPSLPLPSFNFPMWCQSRRRWRVQARPADIPLSFQQPFTSLRVGMEGSREKSKRNKGRWEEKQKLHKMRGSLNLSAGWWPRAVPGHTSFPKFRHVLVRTCMKDRWKEKETAQKTLFVCLCTWKCARVSAPPLGHSVSAPKSQWTAPPHPLALNSLVSTLMSRLGVEVEDQEGRACENDINTNTKL